MCNNGIGSTQDGSGTNREGEAPAEPQWAAHVAKPAHREVRPPVVILRGGMK